MRVSVREGSRLGAAQPLDTTRVQIRMEALLIMAPIVSDFGARCKTGGGKPLATDASRNSMRSQHRNAYCRSREPRPLSRGLGRN